MESLTVEELRIEHRYRVLERLGILCEDGYTSAQAEEIAQREADDWMNEAINSISNKP